MIKKNLLIGLICILFQHIHAKDTPPASENSVEWTARWITTIHGKYNPAEKGVFLFRKDFTIKKNYEEFMIHISADNRYELFVNGEYTGKGPARSVPSHWNYETYDIASLLKKGKNVLAVKVWNWTNLPWAQTTLRTGLIVQGNSEDESFVNTDYSWKVTKEDAWSFFNYSPDEFHHTTGVGPCEKIDGTKKIWDWKEPEFDISNWTDAEEIFAGQSETPNNKGFNWSLTPSPIPQMEGTLVRLEKIIRSSGVDAEESFCKGENKIVIPAHSKATILFDNSDLTVAYPLLTVDKGRGSEIKLTYSEALFNAELEKANRNKVEGMRIKGYYDVFIPDGNERTFKPLWNRTYRFLQMDVVTDTAPLIIKDYKGITDIYPFELRADFSSSDPYLEEIFRVGWRTGRMCALENYVDCPYYEQLQYFGDLNISNPITVLLSGDARLMRSAILQGKYSITGEGITLCAAPGNQGKIIPFFSIAWIGMINNYWTYTGDKDFVNDLIPEVEGIIEWYRQKLNNQMMLGPMPHWNFVDCTEKWPWDPDQNSIC